MSVTLTTTAYMTDDTVTTVITDPSDLVIIGPNIPGPPGPAGPEGPQGPQGVPGTAGASTFTRTAAQALSGHRVVKAVAGNAVNYASADETGDALLIEGITAEAAESGADIILQDSGEMYEGSWSWTLGPIFCGINGQLTQTAPAGAWIRQVATAVDSNRIIVALQPPIFTL